MRSKVQVVRFPAPFVELTPRRIRLRLGAEVVADSYRARLLVQYGPAGLPTYSVSREDVFPGMLVDEAAEPDGRRKWTVSAAGKCAEAAALDTSGPDWRLGGACPSCDLLVVAA